MLSPSEMMSAEARVAVAMRAVIRVNFIFVVVVVEVVEVLGDGFYVCLVAWLVD